MAIVSGIERKSFDPKTMDRNWDMSNDKYVSILVKQREAEAATLEPIRSLGERRRSVLIGVLTALSSKIGNVGS